MSAKQPGGGDSPSGNLENDVTQNAPTNTDLWTDAGNYATSFAGGTGEEDDPYLIATAGQLAYLAYLINNSSTNSTYNDLYYEQTADIDLSAHYWDAIGTSSYYFSGHYDGGEFTISGLFIQSGNYQGLFGYVNVTSSTTAVIKNVIIGEDSVIQGSQYVGGVVGYASSSTITNCYSAGSVEGNWDVGGVVGHASSSTITYCYNTGSVTGHYTQIGGVIGYASSSTIINSYNTGSITGSNVYVGGIVGYNSSSTINSCYNLGSVTGNNDEVGGVVGYAYSSTIINCYNTGSVTGNGNNVGGIAGFAYYSSVITNCYNTGSVRTDDIRERVGGIVGYTYSSSTIINCYNTGSVRGGRNIGGVVGVTYSDSTIANCYYGGNCTRSYGIGSVGSTGGSNTGASKDSNLIANAKSLSWYENSSRWNSSYPWDFENTWGFVEGMNDGYPVLMATVKFTVTYEPNGGTGTMESQTKTAGTDLVLSLNTFTRTGYTFRGWATSPTGGVVYANGATYSDDADITLYAVWKINTYTVTYNGNGATGGSMASSTKTYGVALTLRTNTFTRTAFSFQGWAISPSGRVVYGDGASYTTNASITLYAVWQANNPAHYDSTGSYWYIENGKMPQSKVEDSATSTYLSTNWNSLSNGSVYYMDGIGNMQSKVYNGNEYCEYSGEYYLVEPIKWRLQASSNQQTGYGTTTDTLAVMDTIVYVGRYSESAINEGDGYSTTAVGYLDNNQISNDYLVSWTQSMPTYGTTSLYGTSENFTARIFVSSMEEIESVAGDYTVRFSDLVSDYLTDGGADLFYYTRNLGTNINNIVCLSIDGDVTQKKPNLNFLGVQFTIKVTEYACV